MINATTELMLTEYFMIQTVLGKYLDKGRKLFFALGNIILLSRKKTEELFLLTENEDVKAIATEKDFLRYRRIKSYVNLSESGLNENSAVEEVIRIKGNALACAANLRLKSEQEATGNVLYNNLLNAANSGAIAALRIMGILQCEGIFFNKNVSAGKKNLSKAAGWNDVISILALLKYCDSDRNYNIARLNTVVRDTPFSDVTDKAARRYKSEYDGVIKEARLLEKAFGSAILKRENYEPKFARIIFSNALRYKEKEKAIYSKNKELVFAVADLPLKLSDGNLLQAAPDFGGLPLQREDEQNKILRNLENSDLRKFNTYRPLCICSDSKYLLNMYAGAITKRGKGVNFQRIDADSLTGYDLEPSPNNIFVRSINEDKDNRIAVFVCGQVNESGISLIKNILQSDKRAKFHLNSPGITIDLSNVLPVCFCDTQNLPEIERYCDVVRLSPAVDADEKRSAIDDMLNGKKNAYCISELALTDEAYETLISYGVDEAERIIDGAVRSSGVKNGAVKLTKDLILTSLNEGGKTRIGFYGGAENEIQR